MEEPVFVSLTDAERDELSRKNSDRNKESDRDAQARGGRR
jgi:hypothetical protein